MLSGLLCSICNWLSYKKASFVLVTVNKVDFEKIYLKVLATKISATYCGS